MNTQFKKYTGVLLVSSVLLGGIATAAITPIPTISNTFAVAGQVIKSADINKLAAALNILDSRTNGTAPTDPNHLADKEYVDGAIAAVSMEGATPTINSTLATGTHTVSGSTPKVLLDFTISKAGMYRITYEITPTNTSATTYGYIGVLKTNNWHKKSFFDNTRIAEYTHVYLKPGTYKLQVGNNASGNVSFYIAYAASVSAIADLN